MAAAVSSAEDLQSTIRELFAIVSRLEEMYPGRHFTLDGHLVGSLGEVYAAERYGLELLTASCPVHDAKDRFGRLVQIKATQTNRIALSECPNYLIVLHLTKTGEFEEVYNGPGAPVWELRGKPQKTSQFQIALSRIAKLNEQNETTGLGALSVQANVKKALQFS